MWPFDKRKKHEMRLREDQQRRKMAASQHALLLAATSTADAAQSVTMQLKQRLDDTILQFQSTMLIVTDALLFCTEAGDIIACNPASENIFGQAAGSMRGSPVASLFRRNGEETAWVALRRLIKDAEFVGTQAHASIQGVRGKVQFPVMINKTRLDRSDGTKVFLLLVRDLTEISDLRRDTFKQGQKARALFDLSFDGILIVSDDRVVAANKSAGLLFGRSPESMLSMPLADLVDDSPCVSGLFGNNAGAVEIETIREDGTPLQLLFSSTQFPWGEHDAVLLTVKDVSCMKRLQETVRSGRENGVDMIVCFGADLRITFTNEPYCRFYGYKREELIGKDIRTLLNESDRATLLLNLRSLTPTQSTRRMQIQIRSEAGDHLQDWIDHASYDDTGRLIEYQRSGRDITAALQTLLTASRPASND